MKILIIIPKLSNSKSLYPLPLGLGYISSFLKEKNFEIKFLNLNHESSSLPKLLIKLHRKYKFDVVLTGGLTVHYNEIKIIVDCVRELYPKVKVILGGGLISSLPEIMLRDLKPDFIVIGEGEITIFELLSFLSNDVCQ